MTAPPNRPTPGPPRRSLLPVVRRLAASTLASLALLTLPASAPPPGDENRARLESMPLEQRLYLADRLKAFDALDRAEQAAVRDLDAKVAAEPEENRANDYAVLRRYHLWVRSLPEPQRAELGSAPPEKRLALASRLYAEQRASAGGSPYFYQAAELASVSPYYLARQIKVWLSLNAQEKEAVKRAPEAERTKRLEALGREKKVTAVRPMTRDEVDATFARAQKGRLSQYMAPFLKKAEEAKKPERARLRIAEHYFFLENPPARVQPDKLLAFDAALPAWVRGGFDALPPEEARRRLTILYRLIFPPPAEIDGSPARPAARPPSRLGPAAAPTPAKPAAPPARPAGPY